TGDGWSGAGADAAAIGTAAMLRNRDVVYGVVLLWAYTAILVKHLSADGVNPRSPDVRTR
ncbi:MAG: hypothetical protein U1D00_33390, partial [Mycobacterium sp.]|nr:hypothetical protein [Mycobacterium sp.]